jgi:hypothetical protein
MIFVEIPKIIFEFWGVNSLSSEDISTGAPLDSAK